MRKILIILALLIIANLAVSQRVLFKKNQYLVYGYYNQQDDRMDSIAVTLKENKNWVKIKYRLLVPPNIGDDLEMKYIDIVTSCYLYSKSLTGEIFDVKFHKKIWRRNQSIGFILKKIKTTEEEDTDIIKEKIPMLL